ncbi:CDP-alcohol phosphatidyltransferase family protein, partial [Patescibacteria group bacterium]|nr:CDP-alcohol phosphatidyltransferase family protein [Patescibacteria group bacterium]
MRTENFQQKIDNLIYRVFGKIIPKGIKPNHLTLLRFILIPIVFALLYSGYVVWGLIFFIITASTDFLDGTLARKRNQITDLGKIIDPIADKLLIGTMLYFVGIEY